MTLVDRSTLIERFSIWDYVVFVVMLLLSALIGIFYGCIAKKKVDDTTEFLMAGKSMGAFPVAMSLIASFMSAIALLGTPSEVYQHGFIYIQIGISYIIVMFATAFLYLPVFYDLQVTSAYHYLELRFSKAVRMLGSAVFILQMILYMAIVVYAPSLALAQVTGINVYVSVCSICFVCIFYTTLGGMKAVLWTDALQVGVMYGSILYIVINGAMEQGGISQVWKDSMESNRTVIYDGDMDPRSRHTTFTLIFGGYFTWITIYGVNQAQVQRYLCVKTKGTAIRALMMNLAGLLVLVTVTSFGGLVMFSKYKDCDPVRSKTVEKPDQLMPYFVMDTVGDYHGLPGLFVAGIFAGALSTVSSGINSLAAITLEDFIKAKWHDMEENTATKVSKGLSFVYGAITFILVFVAEQLGDVLSAALSIFGIVGGPLVGVFTLGMFFPWANSKGALAGTIGSLLLTLWIGVGAQVSIAYKDIVIEKLPFPEVQCNLTVIPEPSTEKSGGLLELYKVSYILYSAIGCLATIAIGMIVSLITGLRNLKTLDLKLLSPLVKWCRWIVPGYSEIGLEVQEENVAFGAYPDLSMGHINSAYSNEINQIDEHTARTKL